MEHLTRQKQTLEEQLRQKNAAMGNQEEDQEGTSANWRNQEGPEGSNAPNRPDRQEMSRPFIADTDPPHIVKELKMMEERLECMMSALKGRVSSNLDDLVHGTDSPFTISVNSFPLPPKVSYATSGKLRRKQGPARSLGVFQDPDAPSGDTGRDHVQGLPHHVERPRKDMVQQADAQLH